MIDDLVCPGCGARAADITIRGRRAVCWGCQTTYTVALVSEHRAAHTPAPAVDVDDRRWPHVPPHPLVLAVMDAGNLRPTPPARHLHIVEGVA